MVVLVNKKAKPEVIQAIVKVIEGLGFKSSKTPLGDCIMVSVHDLHAELKPKKEDFIGLDGVERILPIRIGTPPVR